MHIRRTRSWVAVAALAATAAATVVAPASAGGGHGHGRPGTGGDDLLPIVFVHGQSGSAQQFESQAMRFTSNGYPQDLLYAFEYDTSVATTPTEALDDFVDDVLEETGAEQVYAIGHSRGTGVWITYLNSEEDGAPRAAKVAKYVNIDGGAPAELPGGVPSIGIWSEWNTAGSGFSRRDVSAQIGPDPAANFYFPNQSHTEVATSAEAFAPMYEFLAGEEPRTTQILPQPAGHVTIAGRAAIFPQNTGYEGATAALWRVHGETGQRLGGKPKATFEIGADGSWGPVEVHPRKHYEIALTRPEGGVHHFYFQPFRRTDHFVRLNTSRPGEGISASIPTSEASTNLTIQRNKEFWGDQGEQSDVLEIDGTNVLTEATSPRRSVTLAVFAYDDGLDGETDLAKGELAPFNTLPFLSGVDVFVPASPDASGTVTVASTMRGGETSTINVPNWPSAGNSITVQFRDDDQELETFLQRIVHRVVERIKAKHQR